MKIIHLILISLFLNLTLATQSQANESPMWPNSHYQKNIPTYSEVLGYEVGERISSHTDMLRFFDALALASPKNIKIFEYGRTWENRKLIYAVIGSAENIANLNQFEADMQHLSQNY